MVHCTWNRCKQCKISNLSCILCSFHFCHPTPKILMAWVFMKWRISWTLIFSRSELDSMSPYVWRPVLITWICFKIVDKKIEFYQLPSFKKSYTAVLSGLKRHGGDLHTYSLSKDGIWERCMAERWMSTRRECSCARLSFSSMSLLLVRTLIRRVHLTRTHRQFVWQSSDGSRIRQTRKLLAHKLYRMKLTPKFR